MNGTLLIVLIALLAGGVGFALAWFLAHRVGEKNVRAARE